MIRKSRNLAAFFGGIKMDFLAKSDGETLIQHTKNLLHEFNVLKQLYPQALTETEWNLLELACKYHDLGKMNDKFQDKLKTHKSGMEQGELPHGLLSVSLIPFKTMKTLYATDDLEALAYAVALHHERNLSEFNENIYEDAIDQLVNPASRFDFDKLGLTMSSPKLPSVRYFSLGSFLNMTQNPVTYHKYVKIKGLLNRIDFAASGHYPVEIPDNGYLQHSLQTNILSKWREENSQADWNEMQEWMADHSSENIVIIAQTGMGKTEGALRWLANDKGFFTLPLKSAINGIYTRINEQVFNHQKDAVNHVGILHSDTQQVLLDKFEKDDDFDSANLADFRSYLNETKSWSLPLTITTLDQVFNIVYRYRGYEPKLATLDYAKVVVDEVQMYSAALLAYLIYGLKMIQKYDGKFAVMTATLAPFVIDLFKANGLKFEMPSQPFLANDLTERHSIKVLHQQLNVQDILKGFKNNKVLVICNTIKKAVSLYDELIESGKLKNQNQVKLIHSRFIRKDRQQLEKTIKDFSDDKNANGIWIGTQVVEASLDLDFDVLYTELSELNSLFQRMGRCYRRRNYDQTGYNVFVYDGDAKLPSGVHESKQTSVYDYEMFLLSKKAINHLAGPISEQEKMNLIEQTYTTANLKESSYYQMVNQNLKYLDEIAEDHPDKKAIIGRFRDIESTTVIPEKVATSNADLVKQLHALLQEHNYKKNQLEIMRLRNKIMDLTVQVPSYLFINQFQDGVKEVEISRYQKITILPKEFEYSSIRGLNLKTKIKKYQIDNFF